MTRDEILKMSREAGLTYHHIEYGEISQWQSDADLTPYLERFAALVADAIRERGSS